MRTHQYAQKKKASQSSRTSVPRPPEVQSLVQPPPIQAKSNEEGLAEHAERLKKFQRLGNSMIQMGPPRLDNDKTSPLQPHPWIQRKLMIGELGDKYEQEADQVASKVVQQINAPTSKENSMRQSIQREKDLEGVMHAQGFQAAIKRQQAIAGGEASPDLESAINRARGSGQPLDAGLQQSMGQAMGADFSGVRVHTNAQSDQLNQAIQARAFTTGQDVFFREGAYQPRSRGGQELIAHELTHVVQQSGNYDRTAGSARLQRMPISPSLLKGIEKIDTEFKRAIEDKNNTTDLTDEEMRQLREIIIWKWKLIENGEKLKVQIEEEFVERMKKRRDQLMRDALTKQEIKSGDDIEAITKWMLDMVEREEHEDFDKPFLENRMTGKVINTGRNAKDKLPMKNIEHVTRNKDLGLKEGSFGRGVESMEERMNPDVFLGDNLEHKVEVVNEKGLYEQPATLLDCRREIHDQLKPYEASVTVFMPVPSEHDHQVMKGLEDVYDTPQELLNIMRAYFSRILKAQDSDMGTGFVYTSDPNVGKDKMTLEYGTYGKASPSDYQTSPAIKRNAKEGDIEERITKALVYKETLRGNENIKGKEIALEYRLHAKEMFPIYATYEKKENVWTIIKSRDASLVGKKIKNKYDKSSKMIEMN